TTAQTDHKRGEQLRDGQTHTRHLSGEQIDRRQWTINTPYDSRRYSADKNVSDPTRPPYLRRRVKPGIIEFATDRAVNNPADRSTAGDKQNNLPDRHKTSGFDLAEFNQEIKANSHKLGLTSFKSRARSY